MLQRLLNYSTATRLLGQKDKKLKVFYFIFNLENKKKYTGVSSTDAKYGGFGGGSNNYDSPSSSCNLILSL